MLLELEAGGRMDVNDILALIENQRVLTGAPWLADVDGEVARLGEDARALWRKIDPR